MADQAVKDQISITTSESKKYLGKNTAAQTVFFLFDAATSVVMVPYLIRRLGIEAYGVITLASQLVAWAGFISVVVVSMIGRFVVLQLSRDDVVAARRYFSTQFNATAILACLLIPVAVLISFLSPSFFRIPLAYATGARIVFLASYLAFLLTMIYTALNTCVFVRQRFYIRYVMEILNEVFRYSTWLVLFVVLGPALWQIGLGYVIGAAVALLGMAIAFGRLTPQLKPSLRIFDMAKFREMTKFGGWMGLGTLGLTLYTASDAPVISRILGIGSVGRYGPILAFSDMLRRFNANFLSLISPTVLAAYGREDFSGCARTVCRAMKLMACGMGVILGVAAGLSQPMLNWWLGTDFGSMYILAWMLLASLAVNLPTDPMATLLNAANRADVLAYSNIGGGVLKVILSIVLLKYTSLGLLGMPIAFMIANSIKNLIVFPYYSSKALNENIWVFYKAQVPSIFVFGMTFAGALWASRHLLLNALSAVLPAEAIRGHRHIGIELKSFSMIAGTGLMIAAIFGIIAYVIVLNADDKRFVRDLLPKRRK